MPLMPRDKPKRAGQIDDDIGQGRIMRGQRQQESLCEDVGPAEQSCNESSAKKGRHGPSDDAEPDPETEVGSVRQDGEEKYGQ